MPVPSHHTLFLPGIFAAISVWSAFVIYLKKRRRSRP